MLKTLYVWNRSSLSKEGSQNTSHEQGRVAVRRDVAFAQQAREISISPVLLIWALGN
jgi:hypothetical protein